MDKSINNYKIYNNGLKQRYFKFYLNKLNMKGSKPNTNIKRQGQKIVIISVN